MTTFLQKLWQNVKPGRSSRARPAQEQPQRVTLEDHPNTQVQELDIPPSDPLQAYLLTVSGVVEIDRLSLDSPTLRSLKDAGVKLAVPLVSQGELIGIINLGPRRSEQDYSTDDKRLLHTLATQAAPALRVAQLARQQQVEARQRERMDQELRVARVVQQTLLPKEVPVLEGWKIAAEWQPARAVSGDFYDFIPFPDGRLGFIVADVTDKGVPAALVMATSRSVLRSVAEQQSSPGVVLEQANNLLCPTMPPKMFVTCLFALLDPASGLLRYANAGHNPPFQHNAQDGVQELHARGMPSACSPACSTRKKRTQLKPGDSVMIYSDGLVEAHNTQGEMFGYPRLRGLIDLPECGEELIQCMLDDLHSFTGPQWEQEDDVTFVTLDCLLPAEKIEDALPVASFRLPSRPGEEREAMAQVAGILATLDLPANIMERIKTAVAEATMNAMEHGNVYQEEIPVQIRVFTPPGQVVIEVIDQGGAPPEVVEAPDLGAKLAGMQSARGWGLYLIRNMVDKMSTRLEGQEHIVELIFKR